MALKKLAPALTLAMLCAACMGEIDGRDWAVAIGPSPKIPNKKDLGLDKLGPNLGSLANLAVPIEIPLEQALKDAIPKNAKSDVVKSVSLHALGLRSLVNLDFSGPKGFDKDRVKNEALIGPCQPGQPKVDFLRALGLFIQKTDAAGNLLGDSVRVAFLADDVTDKCGFQLQVENDPATGNPYNLKTFLPDFKASVKMWISVPDESLYVGGFVSVDWDSEIDVPQLIKGGN